MAHISDELYSEATTTFIKTHATLLAETPIIRDHVQATFHDRIISIANEKYHMNLIEERADAARRSDVCSP